MHPDKLPKISQVETDAATLKYAEMEEEPMQGGTADICTTSTEESSTVKVPSTQPQRHRRTDGPELKETKEKEAHARSRPPR
jgi:hypothetical protein